MNVNKSYSKAAGDGKLSIVELLITISSNILNSAIDKVLKIPVIAADALPLAESTLKMHIFLQSILIFHIV